MRPNPPSQSVIPGFRPALTWALLYQAVVVLLPLSTMAIMAFRIPLAQFLHELQSPRLLAACRLSFGLSTLAAFLCTLVGGVTAWTLARIPFFGRRILDAFIDLPFALPTAVAGLALTALYAPQGMIGRLLAPFGIRVAYAPPGILLAMIFVSFPFAVRTLQPVIEEIPREMEEAAILLGSPPWTTFRRVLFPPLRPALATAFGLSLARSLGEYGSIIFIAGNMPFKTEIAPLLIVTRLEQYDYTGALALAVILLIPSFLILMAIHRLRTLRSL